MRRSVQLRVDVSDAADIGMPARTAVTIVLPEPQSLSVPPVVCFGFPGGGYSRGYFTFDMPGGSGGGQAGWHADRGWIFVACDSLGVGEATVPDTPEHPVLTHENIARANKATVEVVMNRLAQGAVAEDFPAISGARQLAVGHSMGGAATIILQGQHHIFDGVAILAFSAFHTEIPSRPGTPKMALPWIPRGSDLRSPMVVNAEDLAAAAGETVDLAWAFHFDDVPAEIVAADLGGLGEPEPEWRSLSLPAVAGLLSAPGAVATEAAAISAPILVAVGERDVVPDPWLEPKAYKSSADISVYICPRMAHMHNFAGTRERLWRRIHTWGSGVVALAEAS